MAEQQLDAFNIYPVHDQMRGEGTVSPGLQIGCRFYASAKLEDVSFGCAQITHAARSKDQALPLNLLPGILDLSIHVLWYALNQRRMPCQTANEALVGQLFLISAREGPASRSW